MSDLVTLTIDGVELSVPKGTLVADAAKQIGRDIPVFCHHPKLKPVGMCRMCLVEIGMPMRDRATGELLKEADGSPKLNFGRGLQTGCTVVVGDGMVVRSATQPVTEARESVVEFLLTSHPLDCPICDKGGECPLQNLTMAHGRGTSRMTFADKLKGDKHVPLGELIWLDRERCIQCARCIRFQDEVVDDPVIEFHNRGRDLEIATLSDPGFDSYWSGNSTDICPVGALTTADFRFGARPWELTPVASLCTHCPVGCNMTISTRREVKSGGKRVIKRILPRQNEAVNEIWICDKGRFVHHFATSDERLTTPLIRKNGELVEASWDEALDLVAEKLKAHHHSAAGLVNGRLSNEDYFQFQKLFRKGLKNGNVDLANRRLDGGDVVAQVGLSADSDLKEIGAGDAILVVASDLHEEAPVWWLRTKQAAERGATMVTLNARATRLDKFASYALRYAPGQALTAVHELLLSAQVETENQNGSETAVAGDALIKASNLVIFYGSEGLTLAETDALARSLANLLLLKNGDGHAGKVNNGLIPVWNGGNEQGAWDMGIHPAYAPGYKLVDEPGMAADTMYAAVTDGGLQALYLVGADPIGWGLLADRGSLEFLVVQELFMTETAMLADVVLPAQSWAEREGSLTNGERRVQRYYPAINPVGQSRANWQILAQIGERLGMGKPPIAASLLFKEIAKAVPQYKGMDYRTLAQVEKQWPDVGGDDLYFGGNAFENTAGLGQQWAAAAENGEVARFDVPDMVTLAAEGLQIIPITALYTPGRLINQTNILTERLARPVILLHEADAVSLQITNGAEVKVVVNGRIHQVTALVDEQAPAGLALLQGVQAQPGTAVGHIQLEREEEPA